MCSLDIKDNPMKNKAFAIAKTMLNGLHRQIYLFGEITQSAQ